MLIIDEKNPGSAPKPSIFLHGVTGAGKSTWATKGGRPLVILTEPKAMSILRLVNPQAIGMVPQSTKDIFDIFVLLGQPERLSARGIDRIVLDSFTDLTYSLPAWMKDPSGVQILLKMEIQEFGDLKNYALALVKAIQLTGYPNIIIARGTGLGVRGPDRDRGGFDAATYLARGGVAYTLTPFGTENPAVQGPAFGDLALLDQLDDLRHDPDELVVFAPKLGEQADLVLRHEAGI